MRCYRCQVGAATIATSSSSLGCCSIVRTSSTTRSMCAGARQERVTSRNLAEHQALGLRLADPALYQRAPQDVATVRERLQVVESELGAATRPWVALAANTSSP